MFEYVYNGVSAEFEIRTAVFAENAIFCEIIVSIGKHLPKFRNLQGRSVSQSVQCTGKRRPFAVCCWKVLSGIGSLFVTTQTAVPVDADSVLSCIVTLREHSAI